MRVWRSFRDLARAEAWNEWHVAPRTVDVLLILPWAGAVVVGLSRLSPQSFRWITAEDSILEWLQVAGYLAGSVGALLVFRELRRRQLRMTPSLYLLLAFGLFFIAGEEVAWGQRILGLETPESLRKINRQQELTVHNISAIQTAFNWLQMTFGAYGSVGLLWLRSRRQVLGESLEVLTPPLFLVSFFLLPFAFRLFRFTVYRKSIWTLHEFAEWPEACLAVAVGIFTIMLWRRLRSDKGFPPAALTPVAAARAK